MIVSYQVPTWRLGVSDRVPGCICMYVFMYECMHFCLCMYLGCYMIIRAGVRGGGVDGFGGAVLENYGGLKYKRTRASNFYLFSTELKIFFCIVP